MAEIILIEDVVSNKYRPEEEEYYHFNLSKPNSDYLTALQDYIEGEKFTEDVKAKIGDYDISLDFVHTIGYLAWSGYIQNDNFFVEQTSSQFLAETGVNNGDVLKFYIEQDTPTPGAIPLKGTMEQIAEVLEQKASIEYEDKGNLNEKDYLQRLLEVAKNI